MFSATELTKNLNGCKTRKINKERHAHIQTNFSESHLRNQINGNILISKYTETRKLTSINIDFQMICWYTLFNTFCAHHVMICCSSHITLPFFAHEAENYSISTEMCLLRTVQGIPQTNIKINEGILREVDENRRFIKEIKCRHIRFLGNVVKTNNQDK